MKQTIFKKGTLQKSTVAWLLVFAFLFVFSLCIPLTCDDWFHVNVGDEPLGAFITEKTDYLWKHNAARLAGYFFGLVTANVPWLRILIWWGTMCALVYLLAVLSHWEKSAVGAVLALLAIFTAPKLWFVGNIAWYSAFCNYTIQAALLLLYFYIIRDLFSDRPIRDTAVRIVGLLLLGFSSQFFIENATIYTAVMALAVAVWHWIRFQKPSIATIAYLVGAVIGAYAMFSAPGYARILSGNDGYHKGVNSIGALIYMVEQNYATVSAYGIGANTLVVSAISALGIAVIVKSDPVKSGFAQKCKVPLIVLLSALPVYFYATTRYSDTLLPFANILGNLRLAIVLDMLLYALWVASVGATLAFFVRDLRCRRLSLFLLASVLVSVAPLIAVAPLTHRVFMSSYIFLLLLALTLLRYCLQLFAVPESAKRTLRLPFFAAAATVFLLFLCGYITNRTIERQTEQYVDAMIDRGVSSMYIPEFLCPDLLWAPTVTFGASHYRAERGDTLFAYIPYPKWKAECYDAMARGEQALQPSADTTAD